MKCQQNLVLCQPQFVMQPITPILTFPRRGGRDLSSSLDEVDFKGKTIEIKLTDHWGTARARRDPLQGFPLIPADLGLAEDSREEVPSDIPAVWVGYPDPNLIPEHELMSAA